MQGDSMFYGQITYMPIDDQRSKCNLCQRVIYKLLQKAHTTSHGLLRKVPIVEEKPAPNAIKKFSLQFGEPNQEPMMKSNVEKPMISFEQMLKTAPKPSIELPQKTRCEIPVKPCEKRPKSSFSFHIKQSKRCQSVLSRLCHVYQRSCEMKVLKGYRKWKRNYIKTA